MLKDSSNRIHSSFNVIFHIDLMIKKINNRMKFISIEYCPIFSSLNYPGHHNGQTNHHILYTDPRPPPPHPAFTTPTSLIRIMELVVHLYVSQLTSYTL